MDNNDGRRLESSDGAASPKPFIPTHVLTHTAIPGGATVLMQDPANGGCAFELSEWQKAPAERVCNYELQEAGQWFRRFDDGCWRQLIGVKASELRSTREEGLAEYTLAVALLQTLVNTFRAGKGTPDEFAQAILEIGTIERQSIYLRS